MQETGCERESSVLQSAAGLVAVHGATSAADTARQTLARASCAKPLNPHLLMPVWKPGLVAGGQRCLPPVPLPSLLLPHA